MQQQAPQMNDTTKLPNQARATFGDGAHAIKKELKLAPITNAPNFSFLPFLSASD